MKQDFEKKLSNQFHIDILLPFFGDLHYFKEAVLSVLMQSDSKWRLIICDDGYPSSEPAEWVESLMDSRVVYQKNDINIGANKNFAKCITLSTEEYFMFMGADDILHRDYLKIMKKLINEFPQAAIFHPGISIIDENGKEAKTLSDFVKRFLRPKQGLYDAQRMSESLMQGNWLYFPAIVWKAEPVKQVGIKDGLNVCQDLALAIEVLLKGNTFALTDEVIFSYRRHTGSDSQVKAVNGMRFLEEKRYFLDIADEFATIGFGKAAKIARLHPTSRLNSLSLIPVAIRKRKSFRGLLTHALRNKC